MNKHPKYHINEEVLISRTIHNKGAVLKIMAVGYIQRFFFNDTDLVSVRYNRRSFRYLVVGYGKDNDWFSEFWEDEIVRNEEFNFKNWG